MKIDLPIFVESSTLAEVDAFLRRDGVFLPLRLAFDPADCAEPTPFAAPRDTAAAERMRRTAEDAERIAAAHRLIAPIAEIVDRVTPIAATMARVDAAEAAVRFGRRSADAPSAAQRADWEGALRRARARDAKALVFGTLADAFDASLARDEGDNN